MPGPALGRSQILKLWSSCFGGLGHAGYSLGSTVERGLIMTPPQTIELLHADVYLCIEMGLSLHIFPYYTCTDACTSHIRMLLYFSTCTFTEYM